MGAGTETLACLVQDAARRTPERKALVGLTERYTWREYDRAAGAIAAALVGAGIRPGDRVAVAMPKDAHSFIAVHGVLRCGAVVVPVDPLAPPLLARAVLEQAQPSALFVGHRMIDAIDPWTVPGCDLRVVVATGGGTDPRLLGWHEVLDREPADIARTGLDQAAYIIFTSGSTGQPKGIVHTHRSAMAYATRAVQFHGLTGEDRLAAMSPFHFDMSTLELYAAPLAGAAAVVFGEAHLRFPASFTARCESERVTLWYSVPSFFRQVVERGAVERRDLSTLRLVMYGGEPYSSGAIAELMDALPGVDVKNIYGPAEVNECTNHLVDRADLAHSVPIGRPWTGVELMVVDDSGTAVAPGEPGELWVSAPTMMAGYWRRPDLTERSVHPRQGHPDWYATGDIVTIGDDGSYRFLGRRDHQVKVRGIRLELESVEAALTDAPDVLHAVAFAVGPPEAAAHVSAVVVLRAGARLDHDGLLAHCRARLPVVAVPHEIIERTEVPWTPTGKIDRRRVRLDHGAHGSGGDVVVEAGNG